MLVLQMTEAVRHFLAESLSTWLFCTFSVVDALWWKLTSSSNIYLICIHSNMSICTIPPQISLFNHTLSDPWTTNQTINNCPNVLVCSYLRPHLSPCKFHDGGILLESSVSWEHFPLLFFLRAILNATAVHFQANSNILRRPIHEPGLNVFSLCHLVIWTPP